LRLAVKEGLIRFVGRFNQSSIREVTRALEANPDRDTVLDFKDCEGMDAAIAVRIWSFIRLRRRRGHSVEISGLNKDIAIMFAGFESVQKLPAQDAPVKNLSYHFEDIGDKVAASWETITGLVRFAYRAFSSLFTSKFRGGTTGYYMEQTGVMAIPVVVTLNWLMGVVLGYQAGYQMSQFGADLFMPALLAYSICWEIGPMMTAVLVAGRSGSAFAAEIGTMKVRQEIDALEVMGFNLYGYVVTPKLIALFLVMPLLVTIANFAGMAGGLTAGGLFLGMPAEVYIAEARKALIPFDLYWGLIKSLFYSAIIAITGSYMGMRVRGGPAAVGKATTSAVVVSIFLVILVDALLSLVFVHLRPGLKL
jgi:phospholipid/cholesterol/gamma-HCH transport system permease protein